MTRDIKTASIQLIFSEIGKYIDNESMINFNKEMDIIKKEISLIFVDTNITKKEKVKKARHIAEDMLNDAYKKLATDINTESKEMALFEIEEMEKIHVG